MASLDVSLQAFPDVHQVCEESAERPLLTVGGRSLWPSLAQRGRAFDLDANTPFQFRNAAVRPIRPRTCERVAHADDRSRTIAEAGD